MRKVHQLKVKIENWDKYSNGMTSWSIRNNDRKFEIGDICEFQCINAMEEFSEITLVFKRIEQILTDEDFPKGIKKGYCILSLNHVTSTTIE